MWGVENESEDLRPEQVAPGVLYLASPECQESGFVMRAGNGQCTAVRWIEREKVNYPKLRDNEMLITLKESSGRRPAVYAFSKLLNVAEGRSVF